mmetsp:Transcript_24123/g.75065  ORF Transcript_24123/g.75065 Transcript_24123/m.75065 type:complete len:161 (+) Transcript_24123:2-484(+)
MNGSSSSCCCCRCSRCLRGRGGRPCATVGTSHGRLVQLRAASSGPRLLVPRRSLQHRPGPVRSGSLHALPGGVILALRPARGSVQAFEARLGTVAGEWRLPEGVSWLALCGGGGSLFALGTRGGQLELRRFPLPVELRRPAEALLQPEPSVNSSRRAELS